MYQRSNHNPAATSSPTDQDLDPYREILVVDNDPGVASMLLDFLEDEGYDVSCASDGFLALQEIERHRPQLVLADVKMPRVDGISLRSEIGKRWTSIDVVLMSASESIRDDSVRFLRKPFDLDDLMSIIHDCEEKSRFKHH